MNDLEMQIKQRLGSRWPLAILAAVVLATALGARLTLASKATYPGHGDHAFYYTVAENIADGRGLEIDYIWNYLNDPQSITHTSLGFWTPLTSIIISLSFLVFGKSLFAALLPSILFGLALCVPVFFLAKAYSDSLLVAFSSSGLVLFAPQLFTFSLLTDSAVYYALFVLCALLFMIKGRTQPRFFVLAAACTGLAHLTRQDGVLLFATLAAVILIAPFPARTKIRYGLLAFAVYVLVLSPLLVANHRQFGSPFPPGPSKMMFLTHYEDHYSYAKPFEPTHLSGLGGSQHRSVQDWRCDGQPADLVLGFPG